MMSITFSKTRRKSKPDISIGGRVNTAMRALVLLGLLSIAALHWALPEIKTATARDSYTPEVVVLAQQHQQQPHVETFGEFRVNDQHPGFMAIVEVPDALPDGPWIESARNWHVNDDGTMLTAELQNGAGDWVSSSVTFRSRDLVTIADGKLVAGPKPPPGGSWKDTVRTWHLSEDGTTLTAETEDATGNWITSSVTFEEGDLVTNTDGKLTASAPKPHIPTAAEIQVVDMPKDAPPHRIPRNLIFTARNNFFEGPDWWWLSAQDNLFADNVRNTIRLNRDTKTPVGAGDDFVVHFLNDRECEVAIREMHSEELAKAFANETRGMIKADICRVAALQKHGGGYYFDVDLLSVLPVESFVLAETTFVVPQSVPDGVIQDRRLFFQAFIGCVDDHPILTATLHLFAAHYRGTLEGDCIDHELLGTCIMRQAFDEWTDTIVRRQALIRHGPANDRHQTQFLFEEHQSVRDGHSERFPFLAEQHGEHSCNYAVIDPVSGNVPFMSRIEGSQGCRQDVVVDATGGDNEANPTTST